MGIYFTDPDGNGIEVYYELPREQWHRHEDLFLHGDTPTVQLAGPWDEVLNTQKASV